MSVRLKVKTDLNVINQLLQNLTGKLQDLTPVMRDVGEIVLEHIKDNFKRGTAPDGTPWKPSLRVLEQGGKTLIDRGILRNSFHVQPARRNVMVGTADVRAAVHQFGVRAGAFGTVQVTVREHFRRRAGKEPVRVRSHTRRQRLPWGNIPARPFMPDTDDLPTTVVDDIRESILDFLMP
jgi:phage virion morphogenesis protein